MARHPSREWLNRVLEGERLDEAQLQQLVEECPKEDQWLEYKSGRELDEPKKGARTLREDVSAFANAEGGLLIVGYHHNEPKEFDGVTTPSGTATLEEWAHSVLNVLPAAPVPHIATTQAGGKKVLLVAVTRARGLVWCPDGPDARYYLRLGYETRLIPSFLATDLLLGRRSEPQLELSLPDKPNVTVIGSPPQPAQFLVHVSVAVANAGLAFAEDVRAGMVGWALSGHSRPTPTRFLQQQIELDHDHGGDRFPYWRLAHISRADSHDEPPISLGPFESADIHFAPYPLATDEVAARLAVYVVARNQAPWWFQLNIRTVNGRVVDWDLDALWNQRPVVSTRLL